MQTANKASLEGSGSESSPAVDRWTRPAIAVVAVCLMVYVFDVYELTTFQVALPAILSDFKLSLLDAGVLLLITAWVGRIAGLVLVPLADAFGRRAMLAVGVLGYSLLTGFTGLAQNFFQFGVAATATRIPITAGNFPSTIMATEAAPRSGRALAQGLQTAGYPVGFVLVSLASVWLLPTLGWRYMYFLGILPAILVFLIIRYIPESRHFTRVKDQRESEGKQLNVVRTFADTVRRYPVEVAKGSFVLTTYYFWNGFGVFVSTYLSQERGVDAATRGTWLAIWWSVAIAATIGGGWLAQRWGRRWTNVGLVVVTVPLFATYGMLTDWTALFVVGLVLCSLFLAPFGQGTWGWVMEIFPTECRATGFSVANFIGGAVSSFYALIPAVMHSVGASFPVFAAGYALLAIGFLLLNETIREELLELVGERAGAAASALVTERGAVAHGSTTT
jgi:MFS family permease